MHAWRSRVIRGHASLIKHSDAVPQHAWLHKTEFIAVVKAAQEDVMMDRYVTRCQFGAICLSTLPVLADLAGTSIGASSN